MAARVLDLLIGLMVLIAAAVGAWAVMRGMRIKGLEPKSKSRAILIHGVAAWCLIFMANEMPLMQAGASVLCSVALTLWVATKIAGVPR